MEQNVTLQPEAKKPYNILLMLAGISITLYSLIFIGSLMYNNILEPIFNNSFKHIVDHYVNQPIALLTSFILPIVYFLVLILFAVFLFIGKPKFVFPIFLGIMLIYNALGILANFTNTITFADGYSYWIDNIPNRTMYIYKILDYLLIIIAQSALFITIATALIYAILAACKKRIKVLWLIPGIVSIVYFILKLISIIYTTFGYQILALFLDPRKYYNTSINVVSFITIIIISVASCITIMLHFFFLGKGLDKELH